jgi:formamidopyrimidine-DNA glycosylase
VPELPEVEYTRRLLRPAMEGARFTRVITRRADLRYPFPADFATRLQGRTVRALTRRAKYLVAELSSGDLLVMHLGMSGWFRIRARAEPLEIHDHVIFEMSSGKTVVFNDPRRFGFMRVIEARRHDPDWTGGTIGPEPLHRHFTAETLARALHRRTTTLKAALLDQRVVAGLGNIYVCEALHRARLSPRRKASGIVTRDGAPTLHTARLTAAIKTTLRDAIARRHRPAGSDRFLVYDREGERCSRRGCSGVISRIVQAGRSTFFCARCQR